MDTPTKSRARVISEHVVEVQTPDGEVFRMLSDIAKYEDDEYRDYVLHLIEFIFDKSFSDDKEKMINRITWEFTNNGVPSKGIDSGNRQVERERIGKRIRELREVKGMEARDLALLTGIDPANLSRIEQGKYSTGVDILFRMAVVLDAHLDLVPNEKDYLEEQGAVAQIMSMDDCMDYGFQVENTILKNVVDKLNENYQSMISWPFFDLLSKKSTQSEESMQETMPEAYNEVVSMIREEYRSLNELDQHCLFIALATNEKDENEIIDAIMWHFEEMLYDQAGSLQNEE